MSSPSSADPAVVGVASAFPPHVVDREATIHGLTHLFPDEEPGFLANLVERSGIAERRLVQSVADVIAPRDFTERNRRYREEALALALRAARGALDVARLEASEVDALLDVSCTGIAIPALDVSLVAELGLRPDVLRVPVTESGCAAGALGLGVSQALARTGKTCLVVAVELCSLTLVTDDRSRTNLVAAVLFGDGAAAALVRPGEAPGGDAPRLLASASHLIPDSQAAMGFDVGAHGLRIQLQRELPALVRAHLAPVLDGFLARHGRTRADVGLHLIHPGGRRILDAYEALFELAPEALRFSRESMRRYGNLSSASVLTVLELALAEGVRVAPGQCALLVGVGPGISLELALLDWPAEG